MENGALYVALAVLVIIFTVMIWNRNTDGYSRIGGCQVQCQTLSGTARARCIQECLGNQIMRYGGQQCSSDSDCQTEQVCVLGGFYTGEEGRVFPTHNIGTCMDQSDPGTVEWRQRSGFDKPPFPPHDRPDSCMSKCLSQGNSKGECQVLCNPAPSPPSFPSKLGKAAQHLQGKGPAVSCAVQCMNEGGYSMDTAKNCRAMCGLPNPPSSCMLKCRAGGGSGAECHGICDPAPPPDDPTWSFTMSGEISPSKVENYRPQSCPPGQYWDAYVNKGRGGCTKIFGGRSSAWYVNSKKPDEPTEVSIPGTTLPGYGVGKRDPKDVPSGVFISSDPGYGSRKM